jgi:peroxin-14
LEGLVHYGDCVRRCGIRHLFYSEGTSSKAQKEIYNANNAIQRYVIPLIAPPTPPQLEQDKQTIDASFEKAFSLLDQLTTDTEALKTAEQSRTERLDTALSELESVLSSLKESEKKRDDESKRNADEIRGLRDLIPKALEGQKDATDARLKNLGEELKSLSKLISNRVGQAPGAATPSPTTTTGAGRTLNSSQANGTSSSSGTEAAPAVQAPSTNGTNGNVLGGSSTESASTAPAEGSRSGTPTSTSSRFGSGGGKASIPAWQMAAAKKAEEKKDTSASGTVTEATSS